MKVLVIDDDPDMRQTIGRILRHGGYDVAMAEDGDHGLAMFSAQRPDLVLCDLIMPHVDGIQTIAAIRKVHPTMKIIAISGSGRTMNLDGLATALETGADDIVIKPFGAADLLERIATVLGLNEPKE